MRKFMLPAVVLGAMLPAVLPASTAHAQASRTWVSGVGDDVNPCSRTAPCKTFPGAISKTATGGEINCLDPGGFGTLSITKSLTVDCSTLIGGVLHTGGVNGVTINFDSFAGTDTRKSVRIRGVNYNGGGSATPGANGIRILGATNGAGSSVIIENVVTDGNFTGNARGISDERTSGGELKLQNVTVRNMGGTGIHINQPGAAGNARISATLEGVHVTNTAVGVAAGSGSRVMIKNSVFSGITNAGVLADGTTGAMELNLNDSVSANNGTGVQAAGSATVRLSNNDIAFNTLAINGGTFSFGNNRISGNGPGGNTPSPVGGASSDNGQQ